MIYEKNLQIHLVKNYSETFALPGHPMAKPLPGYVILKKVSGYQEIFTHNLETGAGETTHIC